MPIFNNMNVQHLNFVNRVSNILLSAPSERKNPWCVRTEDSNERSYFLGLNVGILVALSKEINAPTNSYNTSHHPISTHLP